MNNAEEKGSMKQILCIVFIIFFACTLRNQGIAQEKPVAEKTARNKASKPSKVIIKARSKGDFFGTVAHINLADKTISVRNKGIVVTFDVRNPIIKDYKNLEQIRIGDKIAISYRGDNTRISKATGIHGMAQEDITKTPQEPGKMKHGSTKTDKKRPVRVKERTNSCHFSDVDNNSDGKITPIELSAVIPDLTVEDFKKYDRNGDGYLNESEYNAIIQTRKKR